MPFVERMFYPMCGRCPGSVVSFSCDLFCQVGPLGGTHLPLQSDGRMESRFNAPLERAVSPMCGGCQGSVVSLSRVFEWVVGPRGGTRLHLVADV